MGNPTKGAAHGWRSHWTLLLLTLVLAMDFCDRQIVSVLIQPIKNEFHVSDTLMGLLGGMSFAVLYSVLAVPAGRFADRSNRRNFVSYCCGIWSLMTVACASAAGYWWLFAARAGVAIGEAGGDAPSASLVADHYPPHQRGRALSFYMLAPQLGLMIGLIGGGWIAQHFGWRDAFLWMSVPGLILAVLLRFTGVEARRGYWEGSEPSRSQEPFVETLRSIWHSRAFLLVTVACTLIVFAGYGIGIWTPAFLMRSYGYTIEKAGAVMGLIGGPAAVIGTLVGGWVGDALAKRDVRWRIGVALVGCVVSLPALLLFYGLPATTTVGILGHGVPVAIVAYGLFAVAAVLWTGPIYAVLTDLIAPHRRATVIATFWLALTLIGAGLGPLAIGSASTALSGEFGEQSLRWALFGVSGVSYVLGILAFIVAIPFYMREHRENLAQVKAKVEDARRGGADWGEAGCSGS